MSTIIDYTQPAVLLDLFTDRGSVVRDEGQALKLIATMLLDDPIGEYNPDWDLDDQGRAWEDHGGPRATFIEDALAASMFIELED
jgi:hypothetical protein